MKFSARHFRIFFRMIYETFLDIWRGGWSNYVVVSILTAVLAIFGFVLQVSFGLNFIGQKLNDQLEFSIYLSDNIDLTEHALELKKIPHVRRIEVVEKDVAWHEFKKNFSVDDDFKNPLPNTVHVRVSSPEYLKPIITRVRDLPGVVDINYAPGVLGFINKLKVMLHVLGFLFTLLLGFVTIIITGNTIQLVIHSRYKEIEVLRLMGVDDWYIKMPLIFQGVFYAVVAATLALFPLFFLKRFLWETAQNLIGGVLPTGLPEYYFGNIPQIYLILLITGIIVTGAGCFWSTRKYLKI
ncbi:MAG: hypothetical protein HYR97_00610 [Candidatus Melainabacteria bacterium]|nr:hypothetical protein [Candidatus Melainabacteria bacterium]MBI3309689.1 hypothetical protein [Candidatus Melainabacteria bacterium]